VIRRSTEQLLRELAGDASPVRRIPPLRAAAAGVLAAWAIAVVALWALRSSATPLLRDIPWADAFYVSVLLGLAALASGATVSALAGAVPGRERACEAGGGVALCGMALAVGAGLWAVLATGSRGIAELASSGACIGHAAALAVLPALVAAQFVARGSLRHPVRVAALGVTGAVALGGLLVHASCRGGGALHMLVGHALAPVLLGLLLAAPVGLSIRWWSRRR